MTGFGPFSVVVGVGGGAATLHPLSPAPKPAVMLQQCGGRRRPVSAATPPPLGQTGGAASSQAAAASSSPTAGRSPVSHDGFTPAGPTERLSNSSSPPSLGASLWHPQGPAPSIATAPPPSRVPYLLNGSATGRRILGPNVGTVIAVIPPSAPAAPSVPSLDPVLSTGTPGHAYASWPSLNPHPSPMHTSTPPTVPPSPMLIVAKTSAVDSMRAQSSHEDLPPAPLPPNAATIRRMVALSRGHNPISVAAGADDPHVPTTTTTTAPVKLTTAKDGRRRVAPATATTASGGVPSRGAVGPTVNANQSNHRVPPPAGRLSQKPLLGLPTAATHSGGSGDAHADDPAPGWYLPSQIFNEGGGGSSQWTPPDEDTTDPGGHPPSAFHLSDISAVDHHSGTGTAERGRPTQYAALVEDVSERLAKVLLSPFEQREGEVPPTKLTTACTTDDGPEGHTLSGTTRHRSALGSGASSSNESMRPLQLPPPPPPSLGNHRRTHSGVPSSQDSPSPSLRGGHGGTNSTPGKPPGRGTPVGPSAAAPHRSTAAQGASSAHETNPQRLLQRRKQVLFGKNTPGYRNYVLSVMVHRQRQRGNPYHPVTPRAEDVWSKRSWDNALTLWRRRLHAWDAVAAAASPEAARSLLTYETSLIRHHEETAYGHNGIDNDDDDEDRPHGCSTSPPLVDAPKGNADANNDPPETSTPEGAFSPPPEPVMVPARERDQYRFKMEGYLINIQKRAEEAPWKVLLLGDDDEGGSSGGAAGGAGAADGGGSSSQPAARGSNQKCRANTSPMTQPPGGCAAAHRRVLAVGPRAIAMPHDAATSHSGYRSGSSNVALDDRTTEPDGSRLRPRLGGTVHSAEESRGSQRIDDGARCADRCREDFSNDASNDPMAAAQNLGRGAADGPRLSAVTAAAASSGVTTVQAEGEDNNVHAAPYLVGARSASPANRRVGVDTAEFRGESPRRRYPSSSAQQKHVDDDDDDDEHDDDLCEAAPSWHHPQAVSSSLHNVIVSDTRTMVNVTACASAPHTPVGMSERLPSQAGGGENSLLHEVGAPTLFEVNHFAADVDFGTDDGARPLRRIAVCAPPADSSRLLQWLGQRFAGCDDEGGRHTGKAADHRVRSQQDVPAAAARVATSPTGIMAAPPGSQSPPLSQLASPLCFHMDAEATNIPTSCLACAGPHGGGVIPACRFHRRNCRQIFLLNAQCMELLLSTYMPPFPLSVIVLRHGNVFDEEDIGDELVVGGQFRRGGGQPQPHHPHADDTLSPLRTVSAGVGANGDITLVYNGLNGAAIAAGSQNQAAPHAGSGCGGSRGGGVGGGSGGGGPPPPPPPSPTLRSQRRIFH